jgi:hypothetical protein
MTDPKGPPTVEEIHSAWEHAFHLARDRGHTEFSSTPDMVEPLLPFQAKCRRCGDVLTLSVGEDGKLSFGGVALREHCMTQKPRLARR